MVVAILAAVQTGGGGGAGGPMGRGCISDGRWARATGGRRWRRPSDGGQQWPCNGGNPRAAGPSPPQASPQEAPPTPPGRGVAAAAGPPGLGSALPYWTRAGSSGASGAADGGPRSPTWSATGRDLHLRGRGRHAPRSGHLRLSLGLVALSGRVAARTGLPVRV